MWRKLLPFIPIIGIPLTLVFHCRCEDTGIENPYIGWVSAVWQIISILLLIYVMNK